MKKIITMTLLLQFVFICAVFAQSDSYNEATANAYNEATMIPPGFINGILQTGILPHNDPNMLDTVLVRLGGQLIGPGGVKNNVLDGCSLVAEAKYSKEQERFKVRTGFVTCIDGAGNAAALVKGFLVDIDGSAGLSSGQPGQTVTVTITEPFRLEGSAYLQNKPPVNKKAIPFGTIDGVLLTGLSPSKSTNVSNPDPVIIKLKGDITGPGNRKDARFDGCFLNGEASYIPEEKRFQVRTRTLYCIDKDGVASETLTYGFLTGADGYIGLSDGNAKQNVTVELTEPFRLGPVLKPNSVENSIKTP